MNKPLRVIVRTWKKEKTPILIFPDWGERNGYVMMWEPVGQHGAGDYQAVIKQTIPSSDGESDTIIRQYEEYYGAQLSRIKKFNHKNY